MAAQLTERVRRWRSQGRAEIFRGRAIHVFDREGTGPPLVLLHGFPSSSFDWRALLAEIDNAVLAFDFLGFGLSDKPRDHVYSLAWQADLVEELVTRAVGDRPCSSSPTTWAPRSQPSCWPATSIGTLSFDLAGVLLFNGSIVLERASLTPSQKLLRSPLGPIASRLSSERFFRHQFGGVFSDGAPALRR